MTPDDNARVRATVAGVFVGGASRRMNGFPKGLLAHPATGEPLLARLVRAARDAGLEPVLVGDARAYESLGLGVVTLADEPAGVGPLGGLSALLAHAGGRAAVAVACDMPNVTEDVLRALASAPGRAAVVAYRRGEGAPWEPMLARYDAPQVRPALASAIARGLRSFQALFAGLEVEAVELGAGAGDPAEDWDTPEDAGR